LHVNEIEHSSISSARFSCEAVTLRVKSDLKLDVSIEATKKPGSITDLNADSRRNLPLVTRAGRLPIGTFQSRGFASSPQTSARFHREIASVCPTARCSLPLSSPCLSRVQPLAAMTDARASELASRRTEFISVSGSRPERTALHSDSRLKRLSGYVAAPELPHAPMNSPAAFRAGFPSQLFAN
jgi:hypothetical protein